MQDIKQLCLKHHMLRQLYSQQKISVHRKMVMNHDVFIKLHSNKNNHPAHTFKYMYEKLQNYMLNEITKVIIQKTTGVIPLM